MTQLADLPQEIITHICAELYAEDGLHAPYMVVPRKWNSTFLEIHKKDVLEQLEHEERLLYKILDDPSPFYKDTMMHQFPIRYLRRDLARLNVQGYMRGVITRVGVTENVVKRSG